MLITPDNIEATDFESIPVDGDWESTDERELLMHRIHHYPAKFKHFIISKSLECASDKGKKVKLLGDVFCGCGTTALEAKRRNLNFWGCDINPVATLIAKVKSQQFNDKRLNRYYAAILDQTIKQKNSGSQIVDLNDRISYWFDKQHASDLYHLRISIMKEVPKGKYRDFFLVGFSNILKNTSNWLSKSIKPQKDPNKKPKQVLVAFEQQILLMRKANQEAIKDYKSSSKIEIVTANFLRPQAKWPKIDVIITSPPYVTSYDYADIHQLSTLWLNYAQDYRKLRKGSIGSKQRIKITEAMIKSLNELGEKTVLDISKKDPNTAKSVARYFMDIDQAIKITYTQLNDDGIAFFVIGNTKYFGVEVNNAKFLAYSMLNHEFINVNVIKRKISSKILTSFRDEIGKFTSSKNRMDVYSYEYIVIGEKGKPAWT